MRHRSPALAVLLLLFGVTSPAHGQSMIERLQTLAQANGERYAAPVYEGLGHALGSGFLRSPAVHEALGFDIGVRVISAIVPAEEKTFLPVLPSSVTVTAGASTWTFTDPYAVQGGGTSPTVAGRGTGVLLVPAGAFADTLAFYGLPASDYEYRLQPGMDLPVVPYATLQAGLGVGFGTEITVRLTPTFDYGDAGSIGGGGFGVTHSLRPWLPYLLVDAAFFAGYQTFRVGDWVEATTTSFGAAVGKGLGPFSAYLIAQYERPSVDVAYVLDNPDGTPGLPADGVQIAFSPSLDPGVRLGVGAQLDLLLVQVAGEYAKGGYDTFTLRAGLGLR